MILDILLVVVLALGFYLGYKQGILFTLASVVGIFLGLALALKFTQLLATALAEQAGQDSPWWALAAFLLIFFGVLLLVRWLAALFQGLFKTLYLNWVNRIIGGLLWGLVLLLVFSTGLWMADRMQWIPENAKQNSQTFKYSLLAGPLAYRYSLEQIHWFEGMYDKLGALMDDSRNHQAQDTDGAS